MDNKLVYNQTWEDPYVDRRALNIKSGDRVICITSGGCNVLGLSLLKPQLIFSVDQNFSQNALLELKMGGIRNLSYKSFWKLFGEGQDINFGSLYERNISNNLLPRVRNFWDDNLDIFSSGLYQTGRLGTLNLLHKVVSILCGKRLIDRFINSNNLSTQRRIYLDYLRRRLWNPITLFIPSLTMFFYGLSIRQIMGLYKSGKVFIGDIFEKRMDILLTQVSIKSNYFWQRILLNKYLDNQHCPDYLKKENFTKLKSCTKNISTHTTTINKFLSDQDNSSIDKFNLSDVPEFMGKRERRELWKQMIRTSKKKARLIYRSVAPGQFIPLDLKNFKYLKNLSRDLCQLEMTGSYFVYVYEINKNR